MVQRVDQRLASVGATHGDNLEVRTTRRRDSLDPARNGRGFMAGAFWLSSAPPQVVPGKRLANDRSGGCRLYR